MAIFWAVLATFLLTLLVTLIVLNLFNQEKSIKYEIKTDYSIDDEQFERSIGHLLPPPVLAGNKVTTLLNGDEIFPPMLEAIRNARKSICFETYVFWAGEIAEAFTAALSERARAGVAVHMVVDWAGGFKMGNEYVDRLKEAGVQVEIYHPVRWYTLSRINNRTHRKILIVDGRVGFTGGVGIADEWMGDATDPERYRDCHFQLEGPCVAQMQSAFMDNWLKVSNRVLHDEKYFPALEPVGDCPAQVFMSSPQEGSESLRLMYMYSIACARRRVWIANAYFIPDDLSLRTLIDARKRGVDVKVIVPGPNVDARVTWRVSRSRWDPLLEAGIEIHEFQPCLFHCKYAVFDDRWASVGSTNFDNRSFRLNDEVNLNTLDHDFAAHLAQVFQDDLARSRRITLEEWKRRPLKDKALESVAHLLRTQF